MADHSPFIDAIAQGLALAIVPLLMGLFVQLLRHFNLQISASQHARAQAIAESAVLAAEEWALNRAKAQLPTAGSSKLQRAVESIVYKIPNIDQEEAHELVNTALAPLGMGASDFLSKVRESQNTPKA